MVDTNARGLKKHETSGVIEHRVSALKERVYATFTGLSVLGAMVATGKATAPQAVIELCVAIFGISIAGFLAEVIAHEVSHRRWPTRPELRTMARIALSALGSASAPAVVLLLAVFGVLQLNTALWIGITIYAVTLVLIIQLASRHLGLRPFQRVASSLMLLSLAFVVVTILFLTMFQMWASRRWVYYAGETKD